MGTIPQNDPNYGQTFTKGVKYIRINKFDKEGNDNSSKLNILDSIRINYSDVRVVEYNILTTKQQGNSYLYGIIPNENTSSLNLIKDYSMTLDLPSVGPSIDSGASLWQWQSDNGYGDDYVMGATVGNTRDAYDSDSGKFTFTLPNTPTSITCSIRTNPGFTGTTTWVPALIPILTSADFAKGLVNEPGMVGLGVGTLTAANTTYTLESSFTNIPGGSYYFVAFFISSNAWQIFDMGVVINQDLSNSSTNSLISFSHEQGNFEYSDYNAILGNATIPQYSSKYQNVDYSTGLLAPLNIDYIISGTAQRASVQDSNYSQKTWSNSRYNGSRVSSTDFNQTTIKL